jgi:hypothetical protein
MIADRSEKAPVKASAVIEQVDVSTVKVVPNFPSFPSESEAEQQSGIPRTNIHRGLCQGWPLGHTFGGMYGQKAPDHHMRERVFRAVSRAALTAATNFTTAFRQLCHVTHEDIDGDLFRNARSFRQKLDGLVRIVSRPSNSLFSRLRFSTLIRGQ